MPDVNIDGPLGSQYLGRLALAQGVQTVATNSSVVSAYLVIYKLSGSGKITTNTCSWAINIDGQAFSGTFAGYNFSGTSAIVVVPLFNVTIVHGTDGKKTLSAGWALTLAGDIPSGSAGGSLTLTDIPRASTASFAGGPSFNAAAAQTIYTNRADVSFMHKLEYFFGAQSGTIGTPGAVGASQAWTPPASLLTEIPNSLSGAGVLRVTTYTSGGSEIGVKDTPFTLNVPTGTAYEPDFGTITHSDTVTLVASTVGAYVQNLTKLALAITSAVGAYGSTIKSSYITVGGVTVLSSDTGLVSGTMASAIGGSGTVAVVARITDSRGRWHEETVNVTVLAYSLPLVSATAQRALSGGTPDDNGTYIRNNIVASVASLIVGSQKNALTLKIYTRDHAVGGAWTLKSTLGPSAGVISYNSHAEISSYAANLGFDVLVEAYDSFTSLFPAPSSYVSTVNTAGVGVHFPPRGAPLGVGKYGQFGGAGGGDFLGSLYHKNGVLVADDSAVVHKTGNETIAGIKSFTDAISQNGGEVVNDGTVVNGASTMYRDVWSYSGASSITDHIVITTPIGFAGMMCSVHITGYDYGSTKNIDLLIGFYPYASTLTLLNANVVNRGTKKVQVRLARTAGNKVLIILTSLDGNWGYPQFNGTLFAGNGTPGRGYRNGWSTAIVASATVNAYAALVDPGWSLPLQGDVPGIPSMEAAGVSALVVGAGGSVAPGYWSDINTVTFPSGRFSVAPVVTLNTNDQNTGTVSLGAQITDVSATAFSYRVMRLGAPPTTSYRVNWHAVQMTPTTASG